MSHLTALFDAATQPSLEAPLIIKPSSIRTYNLSQAMGSLSGTLQAGLETLIKRILAMFTPSAILSQLQNQAHPSNSVAIKNLCQKGYELNSDTFEKALNLIKKQIPSLGDQLTIIHDMSGNLNFDTRFISIPVTVKGFLGTHTVHLLVDKAENLIEFFDSKGNGLDHPNNAQALTIVKNLEETFPDYTLSQDLKRRQNDAHNSAVFVAWHLANRVLEQRRPQDIPEKVDIEAYRLTLAKNVAHMRVEDRPVALSPKQPVRQQQASELEECI